MRFTASAARYAGDSSRQQCPHIRPAPWPIHPTGAGHTRPRRPTMTAIEDPIPLLEQQTASGGYRVSGSAPIFPAFTATTSHRMAHCRASALLARVATTRSARTIRVRPPFATQASVNAAPPDCLRASVVAPAETYLQLVPASKTGFPKSRFDDRHTTRFADTPIRYPRPVFVADLVDFSLGRPVSGACRAPRRRNAERWLHASVAAANSKLMAAGLPPPAAPPPFIEMI